MHTTMRCRDLFPAQMLHSVVTQTQRLWVHPRVVASVICGMTWRTMALLFAQTAATEVRRSMAGYKEVRDNMSEGLRFYMSLQEAIAVLAQQAGDYALTRSLQRCVPSLPRLVLRV